MIGLTPRQNELLAFISTYRSDHDGVVPSYQEMADTLGLASKGRVWEMIVELENRGHVRRLPGHARSLEIVARPERTITIKPRLWPAVRRYAAKHHMTVDQAVNCIVSDYLEAA